ncbi:MAG: hypothetical protein IAE89_13500 [Anaerolineae bacterium]|nr:hypothetical protein [Anaerolineae bacterium]
MGDKSAGKQQQPANQVGDSKSRTTRSSSVVGGSEEFIIPPAPQPGVVRLQRSIGNSGVQRLFTPGAIATVKHLSTAPKTAIQRDETETTEEETEEEGATAEVEGASLTTFEDALNWVQNCRLELVGIQSDFDDGAAPGELIDAAQWGEDVAAWMNNDSGNLDQPAADELVAFSEAYVGAYNAGQVAKAETSKTKMEDAKAQAEALEAKMKSMLGDLRDLQRALFRAEDEDKLLGAADAVAGVLDCSLASKGCIDDIIAAVDSMKGYKLNIVTLEKLPDAESKLPKVLNALEKANKAYAAFQVVRAAISVIDGGKTQAQSTLNALSAAATVASAGGTLLGCSAVFGLYANLYLGPAVTTAVTLIAKIQDHKSRGWNRDMIQSLENFDAVDWSLEPGGRAMFDFMLPVMHAANWGGVPAPVPQTILNYFEDNEDDFNAGVGNNPKKDKTPGKHSMGGEGSAMPMEGMIDETPDVQRIKYWVFNNRQNLWAMFYGNCAVPSGG